MTKKFTHIFVACAICIAQTARGEVHQLESVGLVLTVPKDFEVVDKTEIKGAKSGVQLKRVVGKNSIFIGISAFVMSDFILSGVYRSSIKGEIDAAATESKIGDWRVFSRLVQGDDLPDQRTFLAVRKFGNTGVLLRMSFDTGIEETKGQVLLAGLLPTIKSEQVAPSDGEKPPK